MANLNIPNTKDRTLDAFKGRMVGGGARPNLFECELYFPDDAIPLDTSKDALSDKTRFLVKAASLPASTVATIPIAYRGRELKIGQRVRVEVDIPSENGMLYKDSIVKLDEFNNKQNKIRVTDSLGKVWWVEPTQVSSSFL